MHVLVPASCAVSMSAGGCPVSQLLSEASMSAGGGLVCVQKVTVGSGGLRVKQEGDGDETRGSSPSPSKVIHRLHFPGPGKPTKERACI